MRKVTTALLALCFSGFIYAADEPKAANANEANNSTITDSKVNQAGRDIINNTYVTTPKPSPATKPKTKPTAAPVPAISKPVKKENHAETKGDKSPAIVGDGSTINY